MGAVLSAAVLSAAQEEEGQHEEGGNNRGPAPKKYLAAVNLTPPQPWCAAFVCWCVKTGSERSGVPHALKFSASAVRLWEKNQPLQMNAPEPADLEGSIFCIRHPDGPKGEARGHTGFVIRADENDPDLLHTFEGNTKPNTKGLASRDSADGGDYACHRTRRRTEITLGFLRID